MNHKNNCAVMSWNISNCFLERKRRFKYMIDRTQNEYFFYTLSFKAHIPAVPLNTF